MQPIGATPNGNRRIGLVAGGTFEGARLRGTVLPGGADWIIVRPDGVDHAGCAAGAGNRRRRGDRHDLSRHAARPGRGDGPAQPRRERRSGEYYFRTVVAFETAAAKYDWLNRIIAVGTGRSPARRAGLRRVRGAVSMATHRLHRPGQHGRADGGEPGQGRASRHRLRPERGGAGMRWRRPAARPRPVRRRRRAAPRSSSPCCRPASTCARSGCTRAA